ncbi:hypothetical protein J9303_20470 [Bacillaceae bacterium Marseille-Q3522]|nr:hypothetical protein [Bacillaceae bacterium Marseille-Q3522]
MKDFGYNELFEIIHEAYYEFLETGRGHEYAMARTRDEFNNLGRTEDFMLILLLAKLLN